MRRLSRRAVVLAGAVGVVMASAIGVWAYLSSTGTGSASASVGALSAPGSPSASPSGGGVAVTWTASTIGGTVAATSYAVERFDGSGADLGAASCSPVASSNGSPDAFGSFSCSDAPGPGTFKYEVTATYRSWTSTSGFTNAVSPATSSTSVASSVNPSVTGQQVTFTATVTLAPAGTPDGSVKFFDNTVPISGCTAQTLSGSGTTWTATCDRTYNAGGGSHSIFAEFYADSIYPTSTSSTIQQVVNKANQAITFTSTAPSNAQVGGATYHVTATGGGSGNQVTFAIDSSAASICSISASTVSFQSVGTCVIDADQAGSLDYNAAPQAQQSFAVAKGDQAITFPNPGTKTFDQSPITLSATGGGSGNAVTFGSTTPGVCTSGGTNGATITFVTTGTCTIQADQAGNANWNAASPVSRSFPIQKGNQTISFGGIADRRLDQSPLTVSATASSGLTVSFSSATAAVCTSSGTNGTTITLVATGTCTINADQGGNGNWNAAATVAQSFTVQKGNQTITFGNPGTKTFDQSPITISATASSGLTVAFTSATPSICTSGGSNGATITFVAVGTCTINANQAGDGNWNAAPQVQQSFTISKGSQTITFSNPGPKTFDQSPITVSATASSGLTVAFTSATPSICTSGGSNGATITFVVVGTCTINANQAGNGNWNAAPQVQQSFTIGKGNQTISFTSTAPTDATVGGVTYTAAATATSALAVTFSSATTSVCTSGGTNGATITFVGAGTCTVNADQAGNTNWNAAPQKQQSFTVVSPVTYSATGPAQTWNTQTAKSVSYPSGTNANDLLLLVYAEPSNAAAPSVSGWTLLADANKGNNTRLTLWWKLAAGESSVSITPTPGSAGATAWVIRYTRPSGYPPNPATATATVQSGSANSSSTFTPSTDLTTNATNATVISFAAIDRANTLSLNTARSFGLENALTSTPGTGSVAVAFGDRLVGATGSVPSPTWAQTSGTGTWVWITVAFH